jgi:hypothetical protein
LAFDFTPAKHALDKALLRLSDNRGKTAQIQWLQQVEQCRKVYRDISELYP